VRHDQGGRQTQDLRRQRDSLGMVARGISHHARKAPRNLNAPMRWKFSHLKNSCAPRRCSRVADRSTGVRCAWPCSRWAAARTSSNVGSTRDMRLSDQQAPLNGRRREPSQGTCWSSPTRCRTSSPP
jgi:hypothetical protein